MQAGIEIELYEILKSKIGEKEAKTLVEYIEAKVEKKFDEKKDILATKEDLANVKADLIVEIEKVRKDILATKEDLVNAKAELEIRIEKVRSDIIKWMFIFWAGQIGALIAILQIFFR